jgi:hypothetical protein
MFIRTPGTNAMNRRADKTVLTSSILILNALENVGQQYVVGQRVPRGLKGQWS